MFRENRKYAKTLLYFNPLKGHMYEVAMELFIFGWMTTLNRNVLKHAIIPLQKLSLIIWPSGI